MADDRRADSDGSGATTLNTPDCLPGVESDYTCVTPLPPAVAPTPSADAVEQVAAETKTAESDAAQTETAESEAAETETAEAHASGPEAAANEAAAPDSASAAAIPGAVGPPLKRRRWPYLVVPIVLLLAGFAADRSIHQGKVLRGVTIAGVRLGGLDPSAVKGALTKVDRRLQAKAIPVTLRKEQFELPPESVGMALDIETLAADAMRAGREQALPLQFGWWLLSWVKDRPLQPRALLQADKLEGLLRTWETKAIADPPDPGGIRVEGGKATAQLPRDGWQVDRDAAVAALTDGYIDAERAAVVLPLHEVKSRIPRAVVEQALVRAEALLKGPVTLIAAAEEPPTAPTAGGKSPKPGKADGEADGGEPRRVEFGQDMLAHALRSQVVLDPPGIDLHFDVKTVDEGIAELRKELEQPPVSARFEIDDKEKVTVLPSAYGTKLDAGKVAEALFEAASSSSREHALPIEQGDPPPLTSDDAKRLGVRGLVSKFTTRHGCCRPRVKNIHRIASMLDNTLVRPGEVFSINTRVGERTRAGGFFPAPTIVHGEMKDTVGGGISQFATTFFNAAFYGGYDIIERQPHSYYFKRYPRGIEATLSFPKPDVIIRNDTAAGLLIRCYYAPTFITVKMFGDNGGRKVSRKVSRALDLVKPPIEYEADRRLAPDKKKVKVSGASGWSVYVSRFIEFPDGADKKEVRKVTYKPRPRKLRVHPCKIPEGEDGWTGERCPKKKKEDEDDDD